MRSDIRQRRNHGLRFRKCVVSAIVVRALVVEINGLDLNIGATTYLTSELLFAHQPGSQGCREDSMT